VTGTSSWLNPRLRGEDLASKRTAQQVLATVLETILRLLHPWMPHVTEEVWQLLTQANQTTSISVQPYPTPDPSWVNPQLEREFGLVTQVITSLRNLRAEAGLKPHQTIAALLVTEDPEEQRILTAAQAYIRELAKVESLEIAGSLATEPRQVAAAVVGTVQVLVPLAGLVDVEALRAKLQKDLAKLEKEAQGIRTRLENPTFLSRANPEVVQASRKQLAELEAQRQLLQARLEKLG
jgi:valyl-tRNA synthetase